MRKNDKKQEGSQMLVRLPLRLHMEVKAQAAYRNESMQEYVTEAICVQIGKDKKYQEQK